MTAEIITGEGVVLELQEPPAANVIEALSRVLRDMPGIGKDSASEGGLAYRYRGIEAVTREVAPLLAKHGVVFVPHVVSWDRDSITVNGKPWTDDRMMVEYRVYGPGGGWITVGPIPAIGRDNSDKGANKCMTQAFKYALLQVLCISDGKDDGDQATHEADAGAPVASNETLKRLNDGIRALGVYPDAYRAAGYPNLSDIGEMMGGTRQPIPATVAHAAIALVESIPPDSTVVTQPPASTTASQPPSGDAGEGPTPEAGSDTADGVGPSDSPQPAPVPVPEAPTATESPTATEAAAAGEDACVACGEAFKGGPGRRRIDTDSGAYHESCCP